MSAERIVRLDVSRASARSKAKRRRYVEPREARIEPRLPGIARLAELLNAITPGPPGRGRRKTWGALDLAIAIEHRRLYLLARRRRANHVAACRAATAAIAAATDLQGRAVSLRRIERAARAAPAWYATPGGRGVAIDGSCALMLYEAELERA